MGFNDLTEGNDDKPKIPIGNLITLIIGVIVNILMIVAYLIFK